MNGLPRNYIRRPDGGIEECHDIQEFAEWFAEEENRRIDKTAVPYGEDFKKAVVVATVFLGMELFPARDDAPVLFQTVAKLPDGREILRRFATEKEAREGHKEVVAQVEAFFSEKGSTEELVEEGRELRRRISEIDKAVRAKGANRHCHLCDGAGSYRAVWGEIVACDCTLMAKR